MTDSDTFTPSMVENDIAFPDVNSWDILRQNINANRVKRSLFIYCEGQIIYDGSSSVSWNSNIIIYFLDSTDNMIYNYIAAGSLSTSDNSVLWVRLNQASGTAITMGSTAYASFDRAGALGNQSADVLAIGITTSTSFIPIGWVPDTVARPMTIYDSASNGYRSIYDLKHYLYNAPITGTIIIELNQGWTSTMMEIEIDGYHHASNVGAFKLLIGGYNYAPSTTWTNYNLSITGNPPFSSIRLGYNTSTSHMVIMLGITTTAWKYPKIAVRRLSVSHSNANLDWKVSSISVVTSETNYGNQVTAYDKEYNAVYN